MSMMITQFDTGYCVSVVRVGGTAVPRCAFDRPPILVEVSDLPVIDVAPACADAALNLDDDCERWDGLS